MRGSLLTLILVFLLAGPAVAGPEMPPVWPEVIGDHVGPYAHGHWPVRVRKLERVEWTYFTGEPVWGKRANTWIKHVVGHGAGSVD